MIKRNFIKQNKKDTLFWDIEVDGNTYTITERKIDTDSQITTNSFPDEKRCQKAVYKLVDKIREKGFMEILPEYSEWRDDRKEYAIWRNRDAIIEFLTILKENSVKCENDYRQEELVEASDKVFDEFFANVDKLEILLAYKTIQVRMQALSKYYYEIHYYNSWSVITPLFSEWMKSVKFSTNDKFWDLLKDLLVKYGKAKWFDENYKEQSPQEIAIKKEQAEKYRNKLKSLLKNCQSDLNYVLRNHKNPCMSKNHVDVGYVGKRYIFFEKDEFPMFINLVQEAISAKKALPKDKIIESAYRLLDLLNVRVPLKMLTQIIENDKIPDDFSFDPEKQQLENWEKEDLQKFTVDFTNEKELEKVLQRLVLQFDDYLKTWRYDVFPNNFNILNSSTNTPYNRESDLFKAVSKFPSLEKWVREYVEKITKTNQTDLQLKVESRASIYPRGTHAAGAMVILNPKNDDILLSYIQSIDKELIGAKLQYSLMFIASIWDDLTQPLDLPLTFAAYPLLEGYALNKAKNKNKN